MKDVRVKVRSVTSAERFIDELVRKWLLDKRFVDEVDTIKYNVYGVVRVFVVLFRDYLKRLKVKAMLSRLMLIPLDVYEYAHDVMLVCNNFSPLRAYNLIISRSSLFSGIFTMTNASLLSSSRNCL